MSEMKYKVDEIKKEIVDLNNDLNLLELKQELVSLPMKAYSKALDLMNTAQEINKLKEQMQKIEDELLLKISDDKDLKNQSQRDAKLRLLLYDNKSYNKLKEAYRSFIKDKDLYNAQYNYCLNMLGSLKKIYSERLAILSTDKKVEL